MLKIGDYTIHLPDIDTVEQGKEYLVAERGGRKEKIGFHDYDRIYEIPGLYEYLFYDRYKCNSPEVVCALLDEHLSETDGNDDLRVLDVGAGNGMVAERLSEIGAKSLVGIDIIEEAAKAAERDRPGLYDEYHVADLTQLPENVARSLGEKNFNCMTTVAALGFDDIPPLAFARGFNMIDSPGWVAFNIKEDFVCDDDATGFCRLIDHMTRSGILDVKARNRYRHRYCQDGTPLYYYAIVGEKRRDISEARIVDFQ